MKIPKNVAEQVRERANNRCEYCLSHQNYVMSKLQIDHIYPQIKGGTHSLSNLCLACSLCNQHKSAKTQAVDPKTQTLVSLFDPRQQNWSEHFQWSQDGCQVIGITPQGRGTVIALSLNDGLAVTVRHNWVDAGWHPPDIDTP